MSAPLLDCIDSSPLPTTDPTPNPSDDLDLARLRARQDKELAEAFSQIAAARANLHNAYGGERRRAANAANRNLHHALDRIVTVAFSLLPEVTE